MRPDIRDLYEHVGHLFYAFAAERGMTDIEIGKLKAIVASYWLPRENGGSRAMVTVEGHRILLTIDALRMERAKAAEAFSDFERFYIVYPEVFSAQLKLIIYATVEAICEAFVPRYNLITVRPEVLRELLYPAKSDEVPQLLH